MAIFFAIWALSGAAIHVYHCEQAGTWCGTPIWREPTTYGMFIPAMVVGPLMIFIPR